MPPEWNTSTMSLIMRKPESLLIVHNCLIQNIGKYRLVEQLTMRIGQGYNEALKMHLL